jgi:hypothetical protein
MSRRWTFVLGSVLLLTLAAMLLAWSAISALNPVPLSLSIDGERIVDGIDLASMSAGHLLVLSALLAFVLLAALVVLPMALLLTLLGLLLAALAVVGLPLLLAMALVGLLLSPLFLVVWLLWWMLA